MNKIKKLFIVALAVILFAFLCVGTALPVFAATDESGLTNSTEISGEVEAPEVGELITDDEQKPSTDETEAPPTEETDGLKDIVANFIEYLKKQYGEDYEYYYNQIIENWGSVEAYLLAFGGKLPDEYKTGWDKFVAWLGEYSVIWAPVLAVGIVVAVAILGKKQFEKIVEKIVTKMITPIVKELNLQSKAQAATIQGQKALLGNNPKFATTVTELEISERELKGNE
ncbi:MAG: hypothetical protein K2K80_05550 [Clostridia bacterium]|nr:hypothetical protein [Clostridia bacterium]